MDLANVIALISFGEAARDAQDAMATGRSPLDDWLAGLSVQETEVWAYYDRCRNRASDDLAEALANARH